MSNPGRSSKGLIVRLAVLIVIGGAVAAFLKFRGSPLSLDEDKVRAMLTSKELIGLPVGKAAERLQHKAEYLDEGTMTFDFDQVEGWTAGPVVLDVHDGMVVDAYFKREHKAGDH